MTLIPNKPATCRACKKSEKLYWSWDFNKRIPILVDETEHPWDLRKILVKHECEQDVKPAKPCKYCKTDNLFWVRKDKKYELVESYGLMHVCNEFRQYYQDWLEAKRMNYALEKNRLKSIPDDTVCTDCKGKPKKAIRRRKKIKFPICVSCKGIKTYTPYLKKIFLKQLRREYWPWPR